MKRRENNTLYLARAASYITPVKNSSSSKAGSYSGKKKGEMNGLVCATCCFYDNVPQLANLKHLYFIVRSLLKI